VVATAKIVLGKGSPDSLYFVVACVAWVLSIRYAEHPLSDGNGQRFILRYTMLHETLFMERQWYPCRTEQGPIAAIHRRA
jgi:hypothetical protein